MYRSKNLFHLIVNYVLNIGKIPLTLVTCICHADIMVHGYISQFLNAFIVFINFCNLFSVVVLSVLEW
jgi:hypothetical protein